MNILPFHRSSNRTHFVARAHNQPRAMRRARKVWLRAGIGIAALGGANVTVPSRVLSPAHAQSDFRFSLRAEPDIISANGISTTSITVNVQNRSGASISASPVVRFITTAGTIEPQARLEGGVARVLLRSANKPGTAVVTAIVGASREQIAVEFSGDEVSLARYLQISGAYVAYGAQNGQITASGKCVFDYGDLHIESDVRLDVDLNTEQLWAEGGYGRVIIRNGKGKSSHELRGDRLYYDLGRRRGVMRRADAGLGAPRQEFMDADFKALPPIGNAVTNLKTPNTATQSTAPDTTIPAAPLEARQSTALAPSAQNDVDAAPIVPGFIASDAAQSTADNPGAEETPQIDDNAAANPLDGDAANSDVGGDTAQPETQIAFQRVPLGAQIKADSILQESKANTDNRSGVRLDNGRLALLPPEREGTKKNNGTLGAGDVPLPSLPDYRPLPDAVPPPGNGANEAQTPAEALQSTAGRANEQISEPLPPVAQTRNGYWVAARKVRIFPHQQVQFESSTVFLDGRKLFSMPRYVASLNTAFNPVANVLAFNSEGGITLNVPYYYMASPHGTGTLFIQRAPGGGFAAENAGFALAIDQQYFLSDRSQGRLTVDQLGRGGWNLNLEHRLQFSPTMRGELYLDMPRHRNLYLRSSLLKDLRSMQLGFEGLVSRPSGGQSNAQAQFFARLKPKALGRSGWNYTLAANVVALRHYSRFAGDDVGVDPNDPRPNPGGVPGGTRPGAGTSPGGGIGLPGRPRRGSLEAIAREAEFFGDRSALVAARPASQTRPLWGQTLLSTFQSPTQQLWHGASVQASVLANLFNYSDGRRGFSPGFSIGLQQSLGRAGSLQLDYNYDRGSVGLFNAASINGTGTNFLSGSLVLNLGPRLGGNAFFTKSLSDGGIYGAASLDFYPLRKWRMGFYSDYSQFDNLEAYLDYGLSVGRQIGQREITLNWSRTRGRIYFELGNLPY